MIDVRYEIFYVDHNQKCRIPVDWDAAFLMLLDYDVQDSRRLCGRFYSRLICLRTITLEMRYSAMTTITA